MTEKSPAVRDGHEAEIAVVDDHAREGSSFGAYFNIVCVIAGTGTLQLPSALNQAGWIGVFLILLSAMIAIYTGNLLIKCLYFKPGSRLHGYADVGEAAFGRIGRYVVQFFNNCILLGAAVIYILLTGLNCNSLAQANGVDLGIKVWVVIAAAIIWVPFATLKSLKEVAILSVFGALATVIVVIVTIVLSGIEISLPTHADPGHSFVNIAELPIALASISFSFGGNVVYPHVESVMRHPKSWNRVLTAAIATICGLYLAISIPAYLAYGNSTTSPILDNLPKGAATTSAIVLITAHVILAAPILMTSFSLEVEHAFHFDAKSPKSAFVSRFVLRTVTTILLALIAMFIPFFKEVMSLIGAFANCIIVFVLPVVCYLKLYGLRSINKAELAWCALVVVIGMIGCILGAKDAVRDLILASQGAAVASAGGH